jgi:UDP-N-acetylmuramoyl-tripeptide--D-alanyl-D-alanine ligase
MGANHLLEIAGYCEIANPDYGLITNCGKAHLEGFGGVEGVKKGKGELYDHLRKNNGTAFVMWDYEYLRQMSKGITNTIKYGTQDADITGITADSSPFLSVKMTGGFSDVLIKTQLVGDYNLPNVLAAATVGKHFGIDEQKIISAIENYSPSNSRSQLLKKDSNTFILDAYNANPSSMKLAIENFARMNSENKVLVLGAMAELGNESATEHSSIVELIKKFSWKDVLLVGSDFLKTQHPFHYFENSMQAKKWLQAKKYFNSEFLIKGSRSMKMEKVIED